MPYSESWSWLRLASDLLLSDFWLLLEPEALDDLALLLSVFLPSFLLEELDFALVVEDLLPEAVVFPLLSLLAEDDEEPVEPDNAFEPELLFEPNPLLLLPEDEVPEEEALGELDELE